MEESLNNGKKKPEADTKENEKEKSEKPGEDSKKVEDDSDILSLTQGTSADTKPKYDRQLQKAVDVLQTYNFLVKQRDESEVALKEATEETKTDTENKIEPETKETPETKEEPKEENKDEAK